MAVFLPNKKAAMWLPFCGAKSTYYLIRRNVNG